MPATWHAARSGDLEPYRAEAVVRASEVLEVEDLAEFEARVFADNVTDLSTGQLGTRARRAAVATDRASVEEVAERALSRRGVTCGPDRGVPGLTTWQLSLPTETSARVWAAVDELGREYHRACRAAGNTDATLTQARADALCDLLLGRATVATTLELVVPVAALVDPDGRSVSSADLDGTSGLSAGVLEPATRRSAAEVLRGRGESDEVILSWVGGHDLHTASELEAEYALRLMQSLEIDGNPHLSRWATQDPLRHRPASPPGFPPRSPPGSPPRPHVGAWFVPGHVDARRVGTLLPDDLARLIDDPRTRLRIMGSDPSTGAVATDATVAYRPRAGLLARVRRRDGTCRFPGCATPTDRTQLDHVTPWPHGPTSEDNLVCLCTGHHGFKHHAGWRLSMAPDGVCTWTAPTGREHTTRPDAIHSLSV